MSGQLVGSNGKLTGPVCEVQLQEGSSSFLEVEASAGHQSREKSKRASGRPWIKFPPQFFVSCLEALTNPGDV